MWCQILLRIAELFSISESMMPSWTRLRYLGAYNVRLLQIQLNIDDVDSPISAPCVDEARGGIGYHAGGIHNDTMLDIGVFWYSPSPFFNPA